MSKCENCNKPIEGQLFGETTCSKECFQGIATSEQRKEGLRRSLKRYEGEFTSGRCAEKKAAIALIKKELAAIKGGKRKKRKTRRKKRKKKSRKKSKKKSRKKHRKTIRKKLK